MTGRNKPSAEELSVDLAGQNWQRSGRGPGAIEVALVGEWVLMRTVADPEDRVLVYDRFEWECFLDGVKKGEFDDVAG